MSTNEQSKYDAATQKLKNAGLKPGGGAPQIEKEFGLAYQELVKQGQAMKLKRKYRG